MGTLFLTKLEGVWLGKGVGQFPPNVSPFEYAEELRVTKLDKPNVWEFRSATKNPITGEGMHVEAGFIRLVTVSNTGLGQLEMVVVHPFGLCESSKGTMNLVSMDLSCAEDGLLRVPSSTPPNVTSLRRFYQLGSDECNREYLDFQFEMSTSETSLRNHLVSRLRRAS